MESFIRIFFQELLSYILLLGSQLGTSLEKNS